MERCHLFPDIFYDHHLECELNDSCEGIDICFHSGVGWVNVTQDGVCGGYSPCIQRKIRPTRTQQKHHASDACGLSPWTVQTVVIPWNNQTEWKALGRNLLPLWVIQNTPARKKKSVTFWLTFKVEFKDCGVNLVTVIYVILDNSELSWTLFCFFFGNFLLHILIINVWTKNG